MGEERRRDVLGTKRTSLGAVQESQRNGGLVSHGDSDGDDEQRKVKTKVQV